MKRLLVNRYTEQEVQVWCRLRWSGNGDLEIEELQEDFRQVNLEPPKPPEPPKTFAEALEGFENAGHFKPAPESDLPPEIGPAWFVYDIRSLTLEEVIDPSSESWQDNTLEAWARWALENGVAPFQPFLLSLPKPYYSKSWTDCGYEYDAEYYHAVIDRVPFTPEQTLKQWERYLKSYGVKIP